MSQLDECDYTVVEQDRLDGDLEAVDCPHCHDSIEDVYDLYPGEDGFIYVSCPMCKEPVYLEFRTAVVSMKATRWETQSSSVADATPCMSKSK